MGGLESLLEDLNFWLPKDQMVLWQRFVSRKRLLAEVLVAGTELRISGGEMQAFRGSRRAHGLKFLGLGGLNPCSSACRRQVSMACDSQGLAFPPPRALVK